MHTKDYKEIARIMKSWFNPPLANKLDQENFEGFVNGLADYFERRQKVIFGDDDFSFDREQFLEWCGG